MNKPSRLILGIVRWTLVVLVSIPGLVVCCIYEGFASVEERAWEWVDYLDQKREKP